MGHYLQPPRMTASTHSPRKVVTSPSYSYHRPSATSFSQTRVTPEPTLDPPRISPELFLDSIVRQMKPVFQHATTLAPLSPPRVSPETFLDNFINQLVKEKFGSSWLSKRLAAEVEDYSSTWRLIFSLPSMRRLLPQLASRSLGALRRFRRLFPSSAALRLG